MFFRPTLSRICSTFLFLFLVADCAAQAEFTPLFNGRDLTDWRNVNTAPNTWTVRGGMIVTTGKPIGELCTTQQYENFILELEWRHMKEGGNAGLFIHSDPLTAVGQPFTRAIEAQVMDGNHGDVFAIHGATMEPDRPHPQGWMRSLPIEERAHPTGEWNHYRVESRDGTVALAVNGKIVSGGSEISPRKGYICLESEGSEAHFRSIRINELPSTDPEPDEIADVYEGFTTLYTGVDLSGWTSSGNGPWEVDDWVLRHAGASSGGEHLWTEESYGDFEFIADVRFECESTDNPSRSALFLRGREAVRIVTACSNAVTAAAPALAAIDESTADGRGWQRLRIRVAGDQAVIELGEREIARSELPPGTPDRGPIGLADFGAPLAFANLFIKELNP